MPEDTNPAQAETTKPAEIGVKPAKVETKICTECGAAHRMKNDLCPRCLAKRSRGVPKPTRRKRAKGETPDAGQPAPHRESPSGEGGQEAHYFCDGCNSRVRFLSKKCGKCGSWNDWRGTPAESDPSVILCPECGAFCGESGDNITACPHCNYGG